MSIREQKPRWRLSASGFSEGSVSRRSHCHYATVTLTIRPARTNTPHFGPARAVERTNPRPHTPSTESSRPPEMTGEHTSEPTNLDWLALVSRFISLRKHPERPSASRARRPEPLDRSNAARPMKLDASGVVWPFSPELSELPLVNSTPWVGPPGHPLRAVMGSIMPAGRKP
jgi:hypothetical protein